MRIVTNLLDLEMLQNRCRLAQFSLHNSALVQLVFVGSFGQPYSPRPTPWVKETTVVSLPLPLQSLLLFGFPSLLSLPRTLLEDIRYSRCPLLPRFLEDIRYSRYPRWCCWYVRTFCSSPILRQSIIQILAEATLPGNLLSSDGGKGFCNIGSFAALLVRRWLR